MANLLFVIPCSMGKGRLLVNPIIVDARTNYHTLLSEQGYSVIAKNENGEDSEENYIQKDFERNSFLKYKQGFLPLAFLDNAFRVRFPVIWEDRIFLCVSNHAAKITQIIERIRLINYFPENIILILQFKSLPG